MPQITAKLTQQELQSLLALAQQRGTDANAVLKQAIATESLIARHVGKSDDLLIRKPGGAVCKIVFQ